MKIPGFDVGTHLRIHRCFSRLGCMVIVIALLYYAGFALPEGFPAQASLYDQVSDYLQKRIESAVIQPRMAAIPPKITVGGESIQASLLLLRFYDRRNYRPAWSDNDGPLPQVYSLISAIRQVSRHGLRPGDYHLANILVTLAEIYKDLGLKNSIDPGKLVDLDLLLTDAFLIYGYYLLAGRVNPETIDAGWFAHRRKGDLVGALQTALDSDQIEGALESLCPPQAGYARLQQALICYRNIAQKGGWPRVPDRPGIIKKGNRGEHVAVLRKRLMAEGDPGQQLHGHGDLFDDALKQAVAGFQKRNGLVADGIVGPRTRAALNIPVEERVRQIELNMERWRWLPQDLGEGYILVNIANFALEVVENGQPVLTMRVVVGGPYQSTSVFSANMTYLVLNPYWNIPASIAMEEILPMIRRNPDYLVKQGIKVVQGWGNDIMEIDPTTINWATATSENFRFRLRQEPGPMNQLGRMKFMLHNRFDVYLHDTPNQDHFTEVIRNFSHGCIRIEKPMALAEYVLRSTEWIREKIMAAIDKNIRQTVGLPKPIPVYLVYYTAWVDENGVVQFRDDIDGRDKVLDKALKFSLIITLRNCN